MIQRIICPHCHRPIDPLTLEVAVSAETHYLICPECDEPIVLFVSKDGDALPPACDSRHVSRIDTPLDQEPAWA